MGKKQSKEQRKKLKKQAKRNKRIDKQFEKQKSTEVGEVKILLLGTGDSGKSTIVKQMQILYKGGFPNDEIEIYKNVIRSNIKSYIKTLIKACGTLNIEINEKNRELSQDFLQTVRKNSPEITEELRENLRTLWKDKGLKKAYARRDEFQLPDAANYFLDQIDKIADKNYLPQAEDILYCRIPTVGVKEIHFEVNKHLWRLIDVGGQRSERRKWIHQFDDVNLLIFIVAASEYNQLLYEEQNTNRMQESLQVFKKHVNNDFFKKKDLVLLLNKIDLFKEKVKKYPLTKCFPEYEGGDNYEKSIRYIKKQYLSQVKKRKKRKVSCHYTCSTDTDMTKKVIESVMNAIIKSDINRYFI
ncbi:guanine nucleotide-binding protein g(o) subunit alpha [Anaeramoeba flamelloides]|uniref:Guanine nucleotide-binding protein g(O) subunit alpha n=1 Tax=Anaeramoeba flamelloides TaxID=1746091 RepID=A0AAV7ZRX4_9EUKA|nr:guanine nucleotide-binding protein g(o) subunit alpha [Anaeramoeba flamelloides]KAJ6252441.1 guanine nucleotide-binding protein g(o) subunit alpha [Anaeramoeba flamelloides]